jgi:hypothetical protein
MTESKETRSIIDTHRHIFGPKLRQKFVENIGFDDSKPPQANAGEMFFYRESVDVDYSMEIQRKSGVSFCVNSYGREVETFAQHIIKTRPHELLSLHAYAPWDCVEAPRVKALNLLRRVAQSEKGGKHYAS